MGRIAIKLLPWESGHVAAFTLSGDFSQFAPIQMLGLTVANLLTVFYLVVAAFTRGRRSVHDFVVGTVVSMRNDEV